MPQGGLYRLRTELNTQGTNIVEGACQYSFCFLTLQGDTLVGKKGITLPKSITLFDGYNNLGPTNNPIGWSVSYNIPTWMAGLYEISAYFTGYLNNNTTPQTVQYQLFKNGSAIETSTRKMEHNIQSCHLSFNLYTRVDLSSGNNTISVGGFTNGLYVDNSDRLTIIMKPLFSDCPAMSIIDTTTGLQTIALKIIDTTTGGIYTQKGGYWIIETI